jgi:alginate O-acetyltransferase complex protein AlgI
MIFNQFEFLFIFLPVVFLVFFWARPRLLRSSILLAASLAFYAFAGLEHAVVLVCGVIWVHLITASANMRGNRIRLFAAVTGPLLALTYYKYSQFLIGQVLRLDAAENDIVFSLFDNILLPAGISFFTFQLIAYAIDRYRDDLREPIPFIDFALYVSFFPQLVAGPIVRFSQVADGIRNLSDWQPRGNDIWIAIQYVTFGLAAKILVADTLARYLAPLISTPAELAPGAAIYLVLGYSFQIYFDFYGYSLIAIGLGRFFGFQLPHNFLRPYESLNPRDFWRRWHVTLSFWIRDYLYIPLGGNRRHIVNIVIIFAACGLWHGASWTFVIWGLYHAVLVTGYAGLSRWWDKCPNLFQTALTFGLVSLGWVLFVFDFAETADFFSSLAGLGPASVGAPGIDAWTMVLISAVLCFVVKFEAAAAWKGATIVSRSSYSAGLAILFFASLMFLDISDTFIYFRF